MSWHSRGDYFSRKRSFIAAKRATSLFVVWLGFHIFGIHGIVPEVFGAAVTVIVWHIERWNPI